MSSEHTINFCIGNFNGSLELEPSSLAQNMWQCPSLSVVAEARHETRTLEGSASAQKALKGSEIVLLHLESLLCPPRKLMILCLTKRRKIGLDARPDPRVEFPTSPTEFAGQYFSHDFHSCVNIKWLILWCYVVKCRSHLNRTAKEQLIMII